MSPQFFKRRRRVLRSAGVMLRARPGSIFFLLCVLTVTASEPGPAAGHNALGPRSALAVPMPC